MQISLFDEVLVLGLPAGASRIGSSSAFGYVLRGAVLVDLAMAGCLAIEHGRVKVVDGVLAPSSTMAVPLRTMAGHGRARKPRGWVSSSVIALEPFLVNARERGLTKSEERRFLGLFRYRRDVVVDQSLSVQIMQRVQGSAADDLRSATVFELLRAGRFDRRVFVGRALRKTLHRVAEDRLHRADVPVAVPTVVSAVRSAADGLYAAAAS